MPSTGTARGAYPPYIRARARELRIKNHLSLDELAEHLSLPKTTIYYWIKDLPLGRDRRLREAAYEQGQAEYDELLGVPTFRDFVVLYVAEGYKRNRNRVSIGNSDPRMVQMATGWLRRLSSKPLCYSVQYHADQNLEKLRAFWGSRLEIDGSHIRLQRKSNSGQLQGRTWRSEHGVLTVCVNDTALRARLQAWIDLVRDDWH